MKKIKKPVSIVLALMMVVSLFAIVPITASAAEETITVHSNTDKLSNHGIQNLQYGEHLDFDGTGLPWGTFVAPPGKVFTKIVSNGANRGAINWTGSADRVNHDNMWGEWYIDWETDEEGFRPFTISFTLADAAPPTYTVTWKNGDTTLKTDTVDKDAIPAYSGDVPEKAEDANYTYTFSGWSDGNTTYGLSDTLPAVSGDVTYTAQFTANAKPAPTYTVTWKNWDGSDLEVDAEVEKDTLPTYDGKAPAKAEDGEKIYTFAAWDDGTTTYVLGVDDLPAVTDDVTYTAVFTAAKKEIIDGKYYVGGELTKGTGLVKVGNDIYFVKVTGDIYKNSTLSVAESKTNGLKPQGNYYFNEEGKLTVNNGIVNGFYYVDGILQKGAGLVQIDNDIYFVKQSGAIYKNSSIMVPEAKTNGLKAPGLYFFDEDGKLEEKNGVFGGYYYENNQIVKGKGIVEFENNLYFVKQTGAVYTTHHLMVPEAKTNGLIEPGLYDFEDDGRLIR